MRRHIADTVEINAARDVVWATLTDTSLYASWNCSTVSTASPSNRCRPVGLASPRPSNSRGSWYDRSRDRSIGPRGFKAMNQALKTRAEARPD
jgi:hypothetical protein